MVRIALVSGHDGRLDPTYVAGADGPIIDELTQRGVEVATPDWRDPEVDWAAFDLAVVRTTWDYVDHRDEFVHWAAATGERTPLLNTPDVLRWNTHKSYLLELEERGAPCVPTAWLARGDRVDLAALLRARGWSRAIVKPAVGAGSQGLERVEAPVTPAAQAHLDRLLETDDALVQPYLPTVETRGELSVVVVDGKATHAVRKIPGSGEFRVQQQFGSAYDEEPLDDGVVRLAEWIVESTGHDLLIARVDLIEADDATLQLVELEATEPDLYVTIVPSVAGRIADAMLARVDAGPRT